MKDELAWIYGLNRIAATITKQTIHDFNLTNQETTKLKRKVSCAKMLGKLMYLRILIYYDTSIKHANMDSENG